MRSTISVLLALALLAGCSRAPEPTSQPVAAFPPPQPGDAQLSLVPGDLLTDIGVTPIRVVMAPATATQTLGAVASGMRLRTFPELVDIPFTAVISPGSTGSTGGGGPVGKDAAVPPWDPPQDAYIELTPKVGLGQASWYVVSVDNLPVGVAKPTRAILAKEPNAYAARFASGSSPILRSVELADNGNVTVGFSEGVLIDEQSISGTLQILDDTLAPCSYVPRGIPNGPPVFSTTGIRYKCAVSAYKAKKIRVDLKGPLKTQGGAALQLFDGASATTQGLLKPVGSFDVVLSYSSPSSLTWSP